MVTRRQSVENFAQKMDELINSKFILADNKVSSVLVAVADSVLLYEIFEHVTTGFDYDTVKSVCFAKDSQGKGHFLMPSSERDIMALCFLTLVEIDGQKIDLYELCNQFFASSEGNQKTYARFANEFLRPFSELTQKTAYKLIKEQDLELKAQKDAEEKQSKFNAENAQPKVETTQNRGGEVKRTNAEIYLLKLLILADEEMKKAKKDKDVYEELVFVLGEAERFVKERNLSGITLCFTALKYMTKHAKKVKIDLEHLATLVAEVVR